MSWVFKLGSTLKEKMRRNGTSCRENNTDSKFLGGRKCNLRDYKKVSELTNVEWTQKFRACQVFYASCSPVLQFKWLTDERVNKWVKAHIQESSTLG